MMLPAAAFGPNYAMGASEGRCKKAIHWQPGEITKLAVLPAPLSQLRLCRQQ